MTKFKYQNHYKAPRIASRKYINQLEAVITWADGIYIDDTEYYTNSLIYHGNEYSDLDTGRELANEFFDHLVQNMTPILAKHRYDIKVKILDLKTGYYLETFDIEDYYDENIV